jgi:hypothetical protein
MPFDIVNPEFINKEYTISFYQTPKSVTSKVSL